MKILAVMKYLFLISGALLLIGAVSSYHSSSSFLDRAVLVNGVIIDLEVEHGDKGPSYRPVVAFTSEDNRLVRFSSSMASSPAAYDKGEQVPVLYLPEQPNDARIGSFFELWGSAVIMLVLGLSFFLVGALMVLFGVRKRRKKDYLQKKGIAVQADFQEVRRNDSVSVNGKSPFVIVCHWLNPKTSALHIFESENIWFEPSLYIRDEKIQVLVDKDNPRKYHVDVSFLPRIVV